MCLCSQACGEKFQCQCQRCRVKYKALLLTIGCPVHRSVGKSSNVNATSAHTSSAMLASRTSSVRNVAGVSLSATSSSSTWRATRRKGSGVCPIAVSCVPNSSPTRPPGVITVTHTLGTGPFSVPPAVPGLDTGRMWEPLVARYGLS